MYHVDIQLLTNGQEEICTLAATLKHRYGKSRLADAVNAGVDVHSYFSLFREGKINDLDLSEFTPELAKELKERSKPYKEDKVLKKSRALSKVFNFGCGGGMQGPTMYLNCRRGGFELTKDEAQEYCDIWANTWPEVKQYFLGTPDVVVDASIFEGQKDNEEKGEDSEDDVVDEYEFSPNSDKVQLYKACNNLGMWRVRSSKNASLNFPFQSLAAVVSKRALWLVFKDSLKRGYKLVNFIHDEVICEVPEGIAREVADSVEKCMLQAAAEIMPGMFIKAEPALMRRWSKDAEPEFNDKGELVPYENAQFDLDKFLAD